MGYGIGSDLFSEVTVNDRILRPASGGKQGKQLSYDEVVFHDEP
jgi:hypothetical protein